RATLFPYPTLFRSAVPADRRREAPLPDAERERPVPADRADDAAEPVAAGPRPVARAPTDRVAAHADRRRDRAPAAGGCAGRDRGGGSGAERRVPARLAHRAAVPARVGRRAAAEDNRGLGPLRQGREDLPGGGEPAECAARDA